MYTCFKVSEKTWSCIEHRVAGTNKKRKKNLYISNGAEKRSPTMNYLSEK